MKKATALLLGCIFAASFSSIVFADGQSQGKPGAMTIQQRQQERLAKMTKALNLTSDQQAQISNLMNDKDAKLSGGNKSKEEVREINHQYNLQVKAVLTPAQAAKYEKMMKRKKHHENQ